MPSIMCLMPSFGVRPEGPWTRNGFQRPIHGARRRVGKVRVVIDMEMGEENIVDRLQRHGHRDDVPHAARAEIKKNRLPFPSSTMMQVPAWARVTGIGVLPMKETAFRRGRSLLARVVDVVAGEASGGNRAAT